MQICGAYLSDGHFCEGRKEKEESRHQTQASLAFAGRRVAKPNISIHGHSGKNRPGTWKVLPGGKVPGKMRVDRPGVGKRVARIE